MKTSNMKKITQSKKIKMFIFRTDSYAHFSVLMASFGFALSFQLHRQYGDEDISFNLSPDIFTLIPTLLVTLSA